MCIDLGLTLTRFLGPAGARRCCKVLMTGTTMQLDVRQVGCAPVGCALMQAAPPDMTSSSSACQGGLLRMQRLFVCSVHMCQTAAAGGCGEAGQQYHLC